MNETKIAVVGCGRMGSLLVGKLSSKYQVSVYDQNSSAACVLREKYNVHFIEELHELEKADLVILALATEIIPQALKEINPYLKTNGVLINIATTFPHSKLETNNRKVSAKIIGHAKEMALGEEPVIILEGSDNACETLAKEIFSHVGKVVMGDTDIVSEINTIAAKQGILAGLAIQKELKKLNIPEEAIVAAIRIVAAGTMKAFAIGDAGPFAQKIIAEQEKTTM